MNSLGKSNEKKTNIPPEPLCLFCFPEDAFLTSSFKTTYVNVLPKKESPARFLRRKTAKKENQKQEEIAYKERIEFWQKKRTEARIIRRRMKEPIRNLKSYLLTSIKNGNTNVLPSLFEVLETVKDAWPATPKRNIFSISHQQQNNQKEEPQDNTFIKSKMKEEIQVQLLSPLPNRRFSMPEELMRKYSISRDKSYEESEENKTMMEMSYSSSSTPEQKETVRTKKLSGSEVQTNLETSKKENLKDDIHEELERKPQTELPKRVTQNDFYCHGKRFLKVKSVEKSIQVDECTCRTEKNSSTSVSVKEETEESASTESIPSSSPFLLPKRESSSDNLSSESDCMRCTCREVTSSKETSTDIFHSGKSTLSQTVTDKSSSTQDATISVRSVSTRGSSASDDSYSTPERDRTSAKETTTTTSDYSPRTSKNTKNCKSRKKDRHNHQKPCPKYYEIKHSKNFNSKRQCDLKMKHMNDFKKTCGTNTEFLIKVEQNSKKTEDLKTETGEITSHALQMTEDKYKKARLSPEELYMMQQLRHQKLVEKGFMMPLELKEHDRTESVKISTDITESTSITTVKTSTSEKTNFIDQSIMIPRYSALPRTLSMVVNTSSADNNSDSDNQSLVDSLEDQPITHVHNLYFDTKKELKPVRGDANTLLENKQIKRPPKGKAFFVSIKDPYGESEMLEGIQKIPQPPEKIKNQIFERHLSICTKYKQFYEEHKGTKTIDRKKKTRNIKNENYGKTKKTNKQEENKKEEKKIQKKQQDDEKFTKAQKEEEKKEKFKTNIKKKRETKDQKGKFSSKIPVLVSSRSSSSIEGEGDLSKKSVKKEKGTIETTQILEITHSNMEVGLQKPQAVIHPSQIPLEAENLHHRPLIMPPIIPELKIPTSLNQPFNKPIFFTPMRRSPVTKFRQRFEVIPEEKSSSLSSTEEKIASDSKFKDISTSPLLLESPNSKQERIPTSQEDDMANLLVAQIKDTHFKNLPYIKSNDDQKIILFSSKPQNSNSNSSKGRDALFAMNREDFKRLAKGWMNFYKLIENWDNSEDEKMTEHQKNKENIKTSTLEELKDNNSKNHTTAINNKKNENAKPIKQRTETDVTEIKPTKEGENLSKTELKSLKSPQIDENIRFHSSNTVLRTRKKISPCDSSRTSLPELNLPKRKEKKLCKSKSTVAVLPKVSKFLEDDDTTDSDSTDYMEPPSPRVPPLSLGDFPSDGTISSSDNELEEIKPQVKHHQIKSFYGKKKETLNGTRSIKGNHFQTFKHGKKKNSGWSVTVAGTVELSRSSPDLEMRLSFPVNGRPPTMCQSDSGFAEESNYSKTSELQHLNLHNLKKDLSLGSGNMKQKWTVTVKNPDQGKEAQDHESKPSKNANHILPNLGPPQNRNAKTVLKVAESEKSLKIIEQKIYAVWPKVKKIIQEEFFSESGRLVTEFQEDLDEGCLTVRGTAVVLGKKQKPTSMTERDVTRRYSSRKSTEYLENGQEIDK